MLSLLRRFREPTLSAIAASGCNPKMNPKTTCTQPRDTRDACQSHVPLKVLHVVGSMNRGGVETWLMNLLRSIDRDRFEFHFLVSNSAEGAYDQEIVALGGRIHHAVNPKNVAQYSKRFREVTHAFGPFTVLHSHVYWYSGHLMRLGFKAGIPIRIAHSHTATKAPAWKIHRQVYQVAMRWLIQRYSTDRIGASRRAGEALFGCHRQHSVLYYGIDFTPYSARLYKSAAKEGIGVPSERFVIGHVGRFEQVKNHGFIVDCFERILARGLNAHLLFVGDGAELGEIRTRIVSQGLQDRCTFAGVQSKIVPYLCAMDVFVLPSQWEGLGLVALEAQAAGIPVVASTMVPDEVDVIPSLAHHLALADGPEVWASALIEKMLAPKPSVAVEAQILQNSRFGLKACLNHLLPIYLRRPESGHQIGFS
jgi:glycosyltransferase involved in cell wall biosynthesis